MSYSEFRISIPSAGGYSKLKLEALRDSALGANMDGVPDEKRVRVSIHAAGVNYADVCIRWGLYESAKKFVGWPITPGFEFAGVVRAAPKGSAFAVGQRVYGVSLFGAYSTDITVPEWQLFPLPDDTATDAAAATLCVFLTAWYAAVRLADVRPGQTVLVHSAAGGVGSTLCQILALKGCRVAGVVGGRAKTAAAKAAGCDIVIDKSSMALWGVASRFAPAGFDAVFDANGVATLADSYAHLSPGGRLVVYGFHTMLPRTGGRLGPAEWLRLAVSFLRTPRFSPLHMTSANKSVLAFNLSFMFDRVDVLADAMADLRAWTAAGTLRSPTVTRYAMEEVALAHRDIESGKTTGKLVLVTPAGTAAGLAPNNHSAPWATDVAVLVSEARMRGYVTLLLAALAFGVVGSVIAVLRA